MGLPRINIEFKSTGITAIKRGSRGIVALLLKDTKALGYHELYTPADIPADLTAANKEQITLAQTGSVKAPSKVILYVVDPVVDTEYLATASNFLQTCKFDYFVFPEVATNEATTVVNWIKSCRDNLGIKVKAVLPNQPADNEGVINFATDQIKTATKTYTTAEYCARIAGMIAGCPLTIAVTYQPLPEVQDVPRLTKDNLDAAIDAGKLVIYNDGEKVKIARGVNSLVTTTQDKGTDFQKIKIVDILDLIFMDIKRTAENSYIGKYANSYDNKCLLVSAIQGYFEQLELDGLLDKGKNQTYIDMAAQAVYLKSIGVDVNVMKDIDIKTANTKDKVFLGANLKPLDAIEEINLKILV